MSSSKADFSAYFNDHHDAVIFLAPSGTIIEVNRAAEEMFGYSRDEMLGRDNIELIDFQHIDPSIIEMMIKNVFDGESHLADLQAKRRDGIVFPVEILMNRVGPEKDPSLVLTIRDISMRKQVEAAMRESEDRYRSLVDLSPFAIFIIVNGKISYLNPAATRLLKASGEFMVIGQALETFIHPSDRNFLPNCQEGQQDSNKREELEEYRWLDIHGHQVDVQSICLPIFFKGMPATQIIGLDITNNKQLEEQLRQAQKLEAIGMLAGGIAHDFNNILTGIIGFAGLGSNSLEADHPAVHYFKNIEEKSQEAATLIHQLLAFSRKEILNFNHLDLNQVIQGSIEFLGRVMQENIDLVPQLSSNPAPVYADPTALQQILTNLCVNARDAMPDGGSIFIETDSVRFESSDPKLPKEAKAGTYVCLRVRDMGEGIPEEVLKDIYNPFFTTKEVGQGSGLGLSMVYGLIQQHNGFIQCSSKMGEGSVFSLFFPYSDAHQGVEAGDDDHKDVSGGRETILVAEDDADVLTILQGILEAGGYRVIIAKNGRVALEILERDAATIDLVITDLVMPEMSGMELFGQAEYLPDRPEFLFISGYARSSEIQRSKISRDVAFLRKPFTSTQLNQKIRDLLDIGNKRRNK